MFKMIKKNILSVLTALVILYLSLANADTFSEVNVLDLPNLDKVVHMCMYFGLMIVMLYENRLAIKTTGDSLLLAIIPLIYGILMEVLQSWLTTTRTGDVFDAVFDLIGILIALIMWKLFWNFRKKKA
jgi:VanZ family protein